MDTVALTIVKILSKYALDKGAELGKAIGPQALDTAQEMFAMVLARVRTVDPRTADKFPDNPEGYQAPMKDVLQETLAADPDFAAALKARLEAYERAVQTGQHNAAHLEGDGAILGAGALQVGGDVSGDAVAGNKRDIRVDGGHVGVIGDNAHVEGGINTTYQSEGGMFLGDVEAGGDLAGRDMTKTYTQNPDPEAIARAFSKIYAEVAQQPDLAPQDKADVRDELQEVEAELKEKGQGAREGFIRRRLNNIQRMAPDIADTFFTTLANPLLGVKGVIEKIAEKMQDDAGPEPEAA